MIKKHVLKGTPFEVGKQHGEIGKSQVHQSLETYEKLFRGFQNMSWKEARESALVHVDAIRSYDEEILEEMEGIAKGAGVDVDDILALNARTEIALGSYLGTSFSDGCTIFATMPPVSGDTIISQNWDWKGSQSNSLLLLEMHIENKPVVTMVTEGGMVGKIGYNSAGLGLCFNALLTDKKSDKVPIHVALRGVLNSYTLSEALSRVKDGQTAASASLMIGQSDEQGNGLAINAEVSPFGIDLVGGEDGHLVHTNHIISEEIKKKLKDTSERRFEDSMMRYKRGRQLMNIAIASGREIDSELHKKWLSDTFNAPNAINHFCDPADPEHLQMETVFSIIMNLTKREMQLYVGNLAEKTFMTI